jgi:hypothetical protein
MGSHLSSKTSLGHKIRTGCLWDRDLLHLAKTEVEIAEQKGMIAIQNEDPLGDMGRVRGKDIAPNERAERERKSGNRRDETRGQADGMRMLHMVLKTEEATEGDQEMSRRLGSMVEVMKEDHIQVAGEADPEWQARARDLDEGREVGGFLSSESMYYHIFKPGLPSALVFTD